MVVGLSGFAGSGKSTIAEYLAREHGFVRLSFASAVKDVTAAAFGWDRRRLEGLTPQDREWRESPDAFWTSRMGRPFTPRYALQYLGTDIFRSHVLPTIWVDLVIAKIHQLPIGTNVVIDDVRFVNEREALRTVDTKFILVHRNTFPSEEHALLWTIGRRGELSRELQGPVMLHPSEWDWLRDLQVKDDPVILNTGSYDELHDEVIKCIL